MLSWAWTWISVNVKAYFLFLVWCVTNSFLKLKYFYFGSMSQLTAVTVEHSYFLSAHQISLTFCIAVCLKGCSSSLFKPSKAYCMQCYTIWVRWAESKGTDSKSCSMVCGLVWIVLQHKCSSDIKRLKVKCARKCVRFCFFPPRLREEAKSWEIYELVFSAL